jgi:dCTP deaminase
MEKNISVPDGEYYELKPREFILAFTEEYIKLPNHIAARVEGRSSIARLGLTIHQTAPTVHATFEGQLRLEICNNGLFNCRIRPKMKVCQLILERLGEPAESRLNSKYQKQREKV